MTSAERYNSVAVFLHWTIAALILVMIPFGLYMHDLPIGIKFIGYNVHKSIGLVILALSVFRLIWRLMNEIPPLPSTMTAFEKLAAHAGHAVLYVLMIGMPLSGWLMVSAGAKFPTVFFGMFEVPFLPMPVGMDLKAAHEWLEETHELLAYGTLLLLVAHVGAALWHHYQRHDNVLRRMLPRFAHRG